MVVELSLDTREIAGTTVLDVVGEIDVYTSPKLREKLVALIADGTVRLVVNLERVDFIDSTGLGVLVGSLKRIRARDGALDLVCRQDGLLRVFKITGLENVFTIHGTVDEAVAAAER